MKKVIIVGGGISGLTVAYALVNIPQSTACDELSRIVHSPRFDVTVFEADSRPGGKIWSDRTNGFLCEKGVNGFLDNRQRTLQLCKDLGIEPLRSNDNARNRFIYFNGNLNLVSESPISFLRSRLMSWRGKLRMVYELFAPEGPDDETVADFVVRRLGKEALEKLIDPMSSGIFAGNPYKMSIRHCFPRIKEMEQEYGSLIKAMIKLQRLKKKEKRLEDKKMRRLEDKNFSSFQPPNFSTSKSKVGPGPGGNLTSFYNGAQTITDILAERLGGKLKTSVFVKGIEKQGNLYRVHTSEGVYDADIVVLASPAHASAKITEGFDAKLSKALSEITYAPISVICFGYKREKVLHPLQGFGFLVPHKEGRGILGTLWDSSIFPNRAPVGYVLLRSMVGGAQSPDLAMLDDNALIRMVLDELRPIVSLRAEPEMVRIYRWEKAIPQYELGHGEKLQLMDERLKSFPGLYLTGNSYRGVGMNDCIENSYKLADEILSK